MTIFKFFKKFEKSVQHIAFINSQASWFQVDKANLSSVLTKKFFVKTELFKSCKILKINITVQTLMKKVVNLDAEEDFLLHINNDKFKDIFNILDYLKSE